MKSDIIILNYEEKKNNAKIVMILQNRDKPCCDLVLGQQAKNGTVPTKSGNMSGMEHCDQSVGFQHSILWEFGWYTFQYYQCLQDKN